MNKKRVITIVVAFATMLATPAVASASCWLSSDYGAPGETWAFQAEEDDIKEDILGQLWVCRGGNWEYIGHVSEFTPAAAPSGRVWWRSNKRVPLGVIDTAWYPQAWSDEDPADTTWAVIPQDPSLRSRFRVEVTIIREPVYEQHDHNQHGCGVDGG